MSGSVADVYADNLKSLEATRESLWKNLLTDEALPMSEIQNIRDSEPYIWAWRQARENEGVPNVIINGARSQIPSVLKDIHTLLEAVPAIHAMKTAQKTEENPVLATKAVRETFQGLGESTQEAVRTVDTLAHARQNYLSTAVWPIETREEAIRDVKSQELQLQTLRIMLNEAKYQPSWRDNIAATVASFQKDPNETIKSGMVLAAKAVAQDILKNFQSVPGVKPAVEAVAKTGRAFSNSMEYMSRHAGRDDR
ncbi:MAG: hypothetical protein ACK48E_02430 [Holosporales bacterium]|jgi:hypothetical protein